MKSLLLTGLITIAVGSVGMTTVAQTDTQTPQTPTATPNQTLPLPLLQAAPLVQATSKLLGQQSYAISSEVEITSSTNANIAAKARVMTTVAAPNKVKSEIIIQSPDGSKPEREYKIIADGDRVWIYDKETDRYSIGEYKQFIQSSEGLAFGSLAHFYLRTLDTVNSNKIASRAIAKLPPDRLVKYFQRFANVDLQNMTIRNEQIGDTAYSIYDINAADRSYEVTAYVSPLSSNIERIDLIGQQDGLDLLFVEQITSQATPESIPADTFTFVPPNDAEQVESQIRISLF